jgi:hypothetical protein|tara:strand:- start:607 stop:900 length:294 start_codon:yes stop_codon:yes gene_type:complete
MPSYWELKSQLDKLRPVRRVALDDRARIVAEQAKLAADLTAANNVLAEAVADMAVLELQLGEAQRVTDSVMSTTEEAAAEVVTKVLGNEYLMNSKGY